MTQEEGEAAFQDFLGRLRAVVTGWLESRKLGAAANRRDPKVTDPMLSSADVLLALSGLAAEMAYWTEALTPIYGAARLQDALQVGADAGRHAAALQQPVRRCDPKKDGN